MSVSCLLSCQPVLAELLRRGEPLTGTSDNDQLNAQIFNAFITILYMYMFRAISCSSSGGQIVLSQHLVSSL